jgi:hypothetical protein
MINGEYYVRTDEAEDVAASLRHVLACRQLTSSDPHAWKWVVLALHSALQGACVCHLVTTASPVGAVTEKNAGEWLRFIEASRTDPDAKRPRTSLLPLSDLLKRIRKPYSAGDRSNTDGIPISDAELNWLLRFHNDLRNQFVHFEPMGWSLEVSGIPDLARLIARILGDILNLGWAFRHQNDEWREDVRTSLHALSSSEWILTSKAA